MLEVDALLCFELAGEPVDDDLVEVVAAEVRVAVGAEHFEHAAAELEDGDIERAATKVEDSNLHILVCLINAVSQCGCGGFVDNTLDVETCNLSGLLCGLTL